MQDKIISRAIEVLAGKNGVLLVEFLKGKKDVNEFKIAKKLGLTINQTRNILYKLSGKNILHFTRKKDKRKGWYTYFWTFDVLKSLELAKTLVEKEIENQQYLLKSRENKRFYKCPACSLEMTEETALNHEFICVECGSLLNINEDKTKLLEIHGKIEKLKRELTIINEEISKLKEENLKQSHKKKKGANYAAIKKEKNKKGAGIKKRQRKANKKTKEIEIGKNG